jgi:hypothetical protein
MRLRTLAALTVLGVFWAAIPRASVPIGVYAMVEKVVLEPNDTQPQRIQIWGAFALADRTPSGYGPAQRGYLYYSCPAGQETICRNEWNDIKSAAGKDALIGFGDRNRPRDRVRAVDERPASPSTYPIQMGVFKLGPGNLPEAMSARLKDALRQAR